MSAVKLALRLAAVEAIKAAETLVGSNVLDSRIRPIDFAADGMLRTDLPRPFVAVYTDAARASLDGNTGLRANGAVDITFVVAVASPMAQTNKETGKSEIVTGIAATDPDFEALLDVIGVQILRALVDDANPWAQVWRSLIRSDLTKEESRISSANGGGRLAAAQIKLTVDAIADPVPGTALLPDGPWAQLFTLMEAANMSGPLELLQALLDGPADAVTIEKLTSMTTKDRQAVVLHRFEGVPRGTVFSGATWATVDSHG